MTSRPQHRNDVADDAPGDFLADVLLVSVDRIARRPTEAWRNNLVADAVLGRVSAEVVEQVLSRAIDDLETTLTRNGYDAPALIVLLHAKPTEVRDFLAGTLAGDRAREFTEKLRVAGVPI